MPRLFLFFFFLLAIDVGSQRSFDQRLFCPSRSEKIERRTLNQLTPVKERCTRRATVASRSSIYFLVSVFPPESAERGRHKRRKGLSPDCRFNTLANHEAFQFRERTQKLTRRQIYRIHPLENKNLWKSYTYRRHGAALLESKFYFPSNFQFFSVH